MSGKGRAMPAEPSLQERHREGVLVVISGPSGAGKTTICQRVLETMSDVAQAVTCTTRAPRPGEQDGRDYHFLSPEAFDAHVQAGDFLEWAKVHDHVYGNLRQDVQAVIASGRDLLLAIDVQGAASLRAAQVDAVYVFVVPPSWETLETRLQARGSESDEIRTRRLAVARQELRHYTDYDYAIDNDRLEVATEMLRSIIIAERCRISRVGAVVSAAFQLSDEAG